MDHDHRPKGAGHSALRTTEPGLVAFDNADDFEGYITAFLDALNPYTRQMT